MNETIKSILIIVGVFACFTIIHNFAETNNKNNYIIALDNEPYNICGKEVNFSYLDSGDKEISIKDIADKIQTSCDVQKSKKEIEHVQNELYTILDDSSLTKQEILSLLERLSKELDK